MVRIFLVRAERKDKLKMEIVRRRRKNEEKYMGEGRETGVRKQRKKK